MLVVAASSPRSVSRRIDCQYRMSVFIFSARRHRGTRTEHDSGVAINCAKSGCRRHARPAFQLIVALSRSASKARSPPPRRAP
jgi:hypothetical protein